MTTRTRFKVNEQFDSIQGEGLLIGTPSTFIRLQGCPVGCVWCDSGPLADELEGKRRTNGTTANTWGPGGEWKTLDEIMGAVRHNHVIITGGEPTIWDLDPILMACKVSGMTTQLETSGYQALKGKYVPDWVTWSPKENIGFAAPMSLKDKAAEVKFVVDSRLLPADVQTIVDYYYYESRGMAGKKFPLQGFVMMPEGCPPTKESIDRTMWFIDSGAVNYHRLPVRFGWRLQYSLSMR